MDVSFSVDILERLPDDTLFHVMRFLSHNTILTLCCSSKSWDISKFARSDRLWKKKYEDLEKLCSLSILNKEDRKKFDGEDSYYIKYRILKIASYPYNGKVKCTIVGDGAVGKTCFVISYVNYGFPDDYVPTVYDECEASVSYERRVVQMKIVDTAGQQDYDRLRPLSYPGTDIFIIAFSLVDIESLENVKIKWVLELQEHCPETPFILLGTKLDLREDSQRIMGEISYREEKPVTFVEGEKVAKEMKAEGYFECSSKTTRGVKFVLNAALGIVLDKRRKEFEMRNKKKEFETRNKKKHEKCFLM